MSRLGLGGSVLISRIPSPLMVFLVSFHAQIRVDEPLLHAAANYWVPTQHVFHFNGVELCPTIKEFVKVQKRVQKHLRSEERRVGKKC